MLAFAFQSGVDPIFQIKSAVGPTATGRFDPAGRGENPLVSGREFFIQFTVTNFDEFGTITSFDLAGDPLDPGPLGANLCPQVAPLAPQATTTCVIGPFPAVQGGDEFGFVASGVGFRQGTGAGIFDPPLPQSLPYENRLHSFMFVFGTPNGVRIGTSADRVAIDLATGVTLSKPLHVDCSDRFPNGISEVGASPDANEPKVLAFVISKFTPAGARDGGCSHFPKIDGLAFKPVLSDDVVRYVTP